MMIVNNSQLSLFDIINKSNQNEVKDIKKFCNINWNDNLHSYTIEKYKEDVQKYGLKLTWDAICEFLINSSNSNDLFNINNLGELYEIGLAVQNKKEKKSNGQYYTPNDVCKVMGKWLYKLNGCSICDVACGTGNLILAYFEIIGRDEVINILKNKLLYLYDLDETALKICKTTILLKYGKEYINNIHDIHCDFLDNTIHLPKNCKVISNPPYASISELGITWEQSTIQKRTKELYSSFMEKIIKESTSAVIITPYSFIGGKKFYSLRELMNNYSGFVISFDNVPGNIFYGKKHGIFNTNTSNSVRAAITVVNNTGEKGFRISPLIRFKNEERNILLQNECLESFLPNNHQIVSMIQPSYVKCFKELFSLYQDWTTKSDSKLKNFISSNDTNYTIYVPNTCRYFTTGSARKLNRNGSIKLNIIDRKYFGYIYCLINSSFTYWWWRIFDGGITYPVSLLTSLPVFISLLTDEDFKFFDDLCEEMINLEENCITTKLNAGQLQENIKFPSYFRERINEKFIKILKSNVNSKLLNLIHSNKAIKEAKDD